MSRKEQNRSKPARRDRRRRPRLTTEGDDGYRERIKARPIQIGEGIIVQEGLTAIQARRVAQEANCAVGTIFNIFGDIDGLIVAINARRLHEFG